MEKNIAYFKQAIVYQVYPLSFYDSNHDGIGDLQGIILKLDHIKDLGVDVIWLSPVYVSPMDDNGYDIKDYYQVHPIFGTLDDLKELIKQTHQKGMKLIMDLVINHTSDEHAWFINSKKDQLNPYRDYYIWKDQPNDIHSVFGGPAWTYDETSSQYYFHLFSKKQPDLNWRNKKLRQEIYQMINYWIDLGIDGFRLDVIDLIGKDIDQKILSDGPYLTPYLKELYETCFKDKNLFTVGEMPGLSMETASVLTDQENGFLNMVFQFSHISLDEEMHRGKWALKKLDLVEFKKVFKKADETINSSGWNSLFFTNHDQPRAVSRYGNDLEHRVACAKMLFTMMMGMRGTPYIYQGEEIGMTSIKFNIDQYQDIETKNIYEILKKQGYAHDEIMEKIYVKSRDNSRTPMQWNNDTYAGFSSVQPWIDVNPNYEKINIEKDRLDAQGIYAYYQSMIKYRKNQSVFIDGTFEIIDINHESLFCYIRKNAHKKIMVIASLSSKIEVMDLSKYHKIKIILSNYEQIKLQDVMHLPPYYGAIIELGAL